MMGVLLSGKATIMLVWKGQGVGTYRGSKTFWHELWGGRKRSVIEVLELERAW